MRLAYQDAELHNRSYSYESLRKEFYRSYSNDRGDVNRTYVRPPAEESFNGYSRRRVAGGESKNRAYLDELKRHHKEMILDDYTDKIEQLDGQKQQALAKLKECLAK